MFTNYSELQTSVATWLGRSDLTAVVPDFIRLGEATLARRVRRFTLVGTLAVSTEEVVLPSDCAEIRTIRLVTGSPQLDKPLRIGTPVQAADFRTRHAAVPGRPVFCWLADGKVRFVPEPDQSYTAEVSYYQKLVPLSVSAPTNALLTKAPDAYLYAALVQAEPYLENDERVTMWKAGLDLAIEELHAERDREEYGDTPAPARQPRRF